MKKLLLLAIMAGVVGVASTSRAGVRLNVDFGIPLPAVPVVIHHQVPCAPACPPRVVVSCPPPVCRPPQHGYGYNQRNYGYGYGYGSNQGGYGYRGNQRYSDRGYGSYNGRGNSYGYCR
jgi:hypothetical protein